MTGKELLEQLQTYSSEELNLPVYIPAHNGNFCLSESCHCCGTSKLQSKNNTDRSGNLKCIPNFQDSNKTAIILFPY